MSSKLPSPPLLGYIEIRVFSHATEDLEKVQTAVRHTLPAEIGTSLTFHETSLAGHHGNSIRLLQTRLSDKHVLPAILEKIGKSLTVLDKETLGRELDLHIEKSNLYLRFDKQYAFMSELRFNSNDPIHFRIHFKNKTANQITSICRDRGLLS